MPHAIVNAQGKYLSLFGWADKPHAAMVFRTAQEAHAYALTMDAGVLDTVPVIDAPPGTPPDGTTQIFGYKAKPDV
jgi:hypothetical protein